MAEEVRYYLSGPMSSRVDFNYPEFKKYANELRERDMQVVSPHEIHGGDTGMSYVEYLEKDILAMLECDAVVLLPGWRESRGAKLECVIADALDFYIYQVTPMFDLIPTDMGVQDANGPSVRKSGLSRMSGSEENAITSLVADDGPSAGARAVYNESPYEPYNDREGEPF